MQEKFEVEFDGWNATEQVPDFVKVSSELIKNIVKNMRWKGQELFEMGITLTHPLVSPKTTWSDGEEYEVSWELVVKSETAFLQGFNSDTGEYFYTQDLGV